MLKIPYKLWLEWLGYLLRVIYMECVCVFRNVDKYDMKSRYLDKCIKK